MSQLSQFYISTGGNGVESVQAGAGINVDNTDPQNPVVTNDGVLSVVAGAGVLVDNTDPQNPVVKKSYTDTLSVTVGTGGTYVNLTALINALKYQQGGTLYIALTSDQSASYSGELPFANTVINLNGKTWTGNISNCDVVCGTQSTFIGVMTDCYVSTAGYQILNLGANTSLNHCEIGNGAVIYSNGTNVSVNGCYCAPSLAVALGTKVGTAELTITACNFLPATTTYIQTPYGQPTGTTKINGSLFGNVATENSYMRCVGGSVRMGNITATKGSAWPANTAPIFLDGGSFEATNINALTNAAPYAVYAAKGMANIASKTNITNGCNWAAGMPNPNGIYFGV